MKKVLLLYLLLNTLFTAVTSGVPSYLNQNTTPNISRLQLIKNFFILGVKYQDILILLFVIHGIKLSLRQLKRILRDNNLRRRKEPTQENILRQYIYAELQNSGHCLGYRSIWQRLITDHRLVASRDSVLRAMREIDPEGIERRKAHRLKRRKYISKGPNFVWHVDGYDKLKPYGFAIHGAIDGYSRRVLWLEVATSNNLPSIVANYYLDTIKDLGIVPRLLRCDHGTENTRLAVLQPFFRYNDVDSLSGTKSFMHGKSSANQRIEAWWGQLRRHGIEKWISFFKDLQDSNMFDNTNILHVECLRYCFMDLIQSELDRIAIHWNTHEIRQQKNANIPCGKPDLLYFIPELYGGHNFGSPIDQEDATACMEMYGKPKQMFSDEIKELAQLLAPVHEIPTCAEEAIELYEQLLTIIDQHNQNVYL